MRPENEKMKRFLADNGVKATPKFLWEGSLKGCWRLHNYKKVNGQIVFQKWFGDYDLQKKLTDLGFVDFDGKQLSDICGNGGSFSVFLRNNDLTNKFCFNEK